MDLTFSPFLAGFSAGQLLWGPISDRSGRRLPVAAGVVLFVIGFAGCALSATVWQLMGWRVVQAVGASAAMVGRFADGTPWTMAWIGLAGLGSLGVVLLAAHLSTKGVNNELRNPE
jgi:MFS family permease